MRTALLRISLHATVTLALAGCCNDISCISSVLNFTVKKSKGADRVEIVSTSKSVSCSFVDEQNDSCYVYESDDEVSFEVTDIPEGKLTVILFAGDRALSEETLTPDWKDGNRDRQCDTNQSCREATIKL